MGKAKTFKQLSKNWTRSGGFDHHFGLNLEQLLSNLQSKIVKLFLIVTTKIKSNWDYVDNQ